MSWEGEPNYRWVKMYRGQRHRVTCQELGAHPTKESSAAAANAWWIKKRAELEISPKSEVEVIWEQHLEETRLSVTSTIEPVLALLPKPAKTSDRSIKANGENLLLLASGEMKPHSFRELRDYIRSLYPLLGAENDAAILDENKMEAVYLSLKNGSLAASTRKKRWSFFRRYVRYLWEKRLIDLPRNLNSLSFEVRSKKIQTYSLKEVRACLAGLSPRLRLYALLGLNCGMTNIDIGGLTKDMVDLQGASLTRRRVKTGAIASVPTVTYAMWPQTRKLLVDCWSSHATLVLTSKVNTPLVCSSMDGVSVKRTDLIVQQWRARKIKIPLKAFRSISATLLESHESHSRFVTLFLGHSPRGIAAKHYAAPSQAAFDQALAWLHDQLFS